MKKVHYHNTTKVKNTKSLEKKAKSQDEIILNYIKKRKSEFTADSLNLELKRKGIAKMLLTSVRRALSYIMDDGHIQVVRTQLSRFKGYENVYKRTF